MLSYALALAEGVKCMMFYQLNDSVWYDKRGIDVKDKEYYYGLLNRDASAKPSLLAYFAIAEALDGAKFAKRLEFEDKSLRGLSFETPEGPMAILWSRADGFMLSKKSSSFVSPEPWVGSWKTRTPFKAACLGSSAKTVDCIGRVQELKAKDGAVELRLDGAPLIVYGLDLK